MKVPEPRKMSSGNYFIQLRLNGVSVTVTAPTQKECKVKAAVIKAEHRAGERQIEKDKANPTLNEAIDAYIVSKSNILSPSTIRGYRYIQKNRFQDVMKKPIASVRDWQSIINNETTLCSAKTLSNAWQLTSSAMRHTNITPPIVTLPQIVRNERSWLDPDQITVFVKALSGEQCEIASLLALHSLRRSEIFALNWNDIDLKNKSIHVHGAMVFDEAQKLTHKDTNKNSSSNRFVPIMIPELLNALKKIEKKQGPLVTCFPNTLCSQINRICKANKLPEVGVHGLRHSFASLGYHLGMSEMEVMRIGGWSDFDTMRKIYTHLADADRKRAENKMAEFYKNANKNAN